MGKTIEIDEDKLEEMIEKAARRNSRSSDPEQRQLDKTADKLDRLSEKFDELLDEPKKKDKGGLFGGGIGGIAKFMNQMQVDNASRYAVEQCGKVAKGPSTTAGNAIGGNPSLDPTNHVQNSRILAWAVNGIVFNARSIVAVLTYMLVIMQWNIIDVLLGSGQEDEDSILGGDLFEDLILMQVLVGGAFGGGQNSNNSGSGPLGALGGLANIFGGRQVLETKPFYEVA